MNAFMDRDFLLETPTARRLFHDCAENMPIVDYHCHLSPLEIREEIFHIFTRFRFSYKFSNIFTKTHPF